MKKIIMLAIINLVLTINLIGCSSNNTELQKQSSGDLSVVASSEKYKVDIKMTVDENNNPIINKNGTTAVTIISNNSEYIHDMCVSFKLLDSNNDKVDDGMYTNWKVSKGEEKTLNLNLEKFNSDGCHVDVEIITAMVGNDSNSISSSNENSSQPNDKILHSGQSIVLNKDALVCSSKDSLDKMLSFLNANNKDAATNMLLNGQATMLSKGTKINIIDAGVVVTKIETLNGESWFAPREIIEQEL
ncbi:hypothetical protein SR42_15080 [Clostridium botulinum]|uniref:hypothetical protein n=1 Tax=Clostridium botulinum TaxID=1491 RepID=UPI0005971B02|nr:hypothetical protein [Clostridium botulinum]KIL06893.1 hypothetical protein SR42_15080 [Clostridium botulinum]MBY6935316.1 hypothetical protein [Clostridium botulinum]NFL82054.1 hypothetical protein [Clostridium botulinum]NFN13192.1 hypothetical protein [Clostridium botulinum]NFO38199.1 hypothetical protein [Clostridium botulinum]